MEQTLDLTPFTMALREAFPEQVAFCGIQGSYGRGEAGPDSDVDLVVILEEAGARELERYRALIASMPFAKRACGFVCARRALAVWPKFDALQLLLDTKPLYGELSPLLPPMGPGTSPWPALPPPPWCITPPVTPFSFRVRRRTGFRHSARPYFLPCGWSVTAEPVLTFPAAKPCGKPSPPPSGRFWNRWALRPATAPL